VVLANTAQEMMYAPLHSPHVFQVAVINAELATQEQIPVMLSHAEVR
jgi:hypothetical protein